MSETETRETQAQAPEIKPRLEREIEKMGIVELTALRDAVEARRLEVLEEAKKAALSEFEEKLRSMGLTLQEALPRSRFPSPRQGEAPLQKRDGRKTRRDAGQPLEPKYRGPNGETWSGRGREPRWLTALEATGRKREEFRA